MCAGRRQRGADAHAQGRDSPGVRPTEMRYVITEHVVGERAGRGPQVGPMLANPAWIVVSFKVPPVSSAMAVFRSVSACVGFAFWTGSRRPRPCQRVDGVRLILPELPLPQRGPPAARRPDGPALTSGECPAPRQQAALAMRRRSTSRRRTKNTPRAGMVRAYAPEPLLFDCEFRDGQPVMAPAPVTSTTGGIPNPPDLTVSA